MNMASGSFEHAKVNGYKLVSGAYCVALATRNAATSVVHFAACNSQSFIGAVYSYLKPSFTAAWDTIAKKVRDASHHDFATLRESSSNCSESEVSSSDPSESSVVMVTDETNVIIGRFKLPGDSGGKDGIVERIMMYLDVNSLAAFAEASIIKQFCIAFDSQYLQTFYTNEMEHAKETHIPLCPLDCGRKMYQTNVCCVCYRNFCEDCLYENEYKCYACDCGEGDCDWNEWCPECFDNMHQDCPSCGNTVCESALNDCYKCGQSFCWHNDGTIQCCGCEEGLNEDY